MKNCNINKNSTQSGRSMIEMLGVLAIVGVLSVGGIAGYSKAMTKFKINKTADQISQIVTNIRTLYAQQTTYQGLNTANAIKMGVTPDEMGTGTTLTNAFGGKMLIEAPSHNISAFNIALGKLPKEACISLATMDWGSSSSSGLIGIIMSYSEASTNFNLSLNNCTSHASPTDTDVVRCSKDGPMPVTHATYTCQYCEQDRGCMIGWTFH